MLRRGGGGGLLGLGREDRRGRGRARLVGRGGGHGRGRGRGQDVGGVGPEALEVSAHLLLELLEGAGLDVELPFEVGAHFPLHLVALPEGEHALADDGPGLVRVGVVADDLEGDHERQYR